uniref:Lytic transglycosylase n=1 Tax=Fervidobacterium pennivorans TaxID=93466 RepID=A0A7V4NEZ8_FERPE
MLFRLPFKIVGFVVLLLAVLLTSIVGFGQDGEQAKAPEWFRRAVVKKRAGMNLKTAPEFVDDLWNAIYTISTKYDVPPTLIAAVISVESNFANVKGAGDVVGMMQISISTAKGISKLLGLEQPKNGWNELLTNYWLNITYGTAYIAYLYKKHGTFQKALEEYNNGKNKTKYAQLILQQYDFYESLHSAEMRNKQQLDINNSATSSEATGTLNTSDSTNSQQTSNASDTSTNTSEIKVPPLFGVAGN